MVNVLILMLILLNALQGLFCRMFSIHYPGKRRNVSLVYSAFTGAATAMIIFASNGFSYRPSKITVLLGIAGAFFLFGTYSALIYATAGGSYSFFNICGCFGGTLIPLFVTIFVYGESFRTVQAAGFLITLISMVFFNLNEFQKEAGSGSKKRSGRYLFYCAFGAAAVGIYNQLISTQQILLKYQEHSEMIVTIYLSMAVLCMCGLFAGNGAEAPKTLVLNKKSVLFLVLCSSILPIYMSGVLILFRYVSAAMFYMIGNGGTLILSAVFSGIFFKEHFTRSKVFGVLAAVLGAVLLSIP
ncbi:MAG: hypothetical protein HFI26_05060 [Lachnospiraceae bacterium]|jgi:drug/metabolite transporter (DMT)-like permease|nr:hypothetical protein [Lachnospiraceae bacterium]MCI9680736.1 hypothetical protein [Lachnospiraceae bacterium]